MYIYFGPMTRRALQAHLRRMKRRTEVKALFDDNCQGYHQDERDRAAGDGVGAVVLLLVVLAGFAALAFLNP